MNELLEQINFHSLLFRGKKFSQSYLTNEIKTLTKYLQKNIASDSPFILINAINNIKTIIAYYAVINTGKIAVILDPCHKTLDLDEIIQNVNPAAIIMLNTNQITLNYQNEIIFRKGFKDFKIFSDISDVCTIAYTNAEDGYLKGAMITKKNLLSAIYPMIKTNNLTNESATCAFMPFSHLYGLIQGVLIPTHSGGTNIIKEINLLKLDETLNELSKIGTTHLYTVPSIYYLLSKTTTIKDLCKTIKEFYSGGIQLTPYIFECFYKKTNRKIREGYGLTETTGCAAYNYQDGDPIVNSFGIPFPGCDFRIINNNGNNCLPGEVGEILIKGDVVFNGYFNHQKATNEVFENGWLKTGDLGKKDHKDFLYFCGLKKKMINVSGNNIYPARLERLFSLHPNVISSKISFDESIVQGHTTKAEVILDKKTPVKQEEFKKWCHTNINNIQLPKIWSFIDNHKNNPHEQI